MYSGLLVYLMGPSGSGKDSVIDAAREQLATLGVEVVQRVITRSAESRGERALGATPEAFAQMREAGAFALCWRANELWYGIPNTIEACLAAGESVLINGSRGHLPEALARYPDLLPIMLTVAPGVLEERLRGRGRETDEAIESRLMRNDALLKEPGQWQVGGVDIVRIDNSGDLAVTVRAVVGVIDAALRRQRN
ncbi:MULTISPECIES: phosphonate metabolism protein/1,5-bisphosphokinase (PRPP-forming) PhnN [unclassified Pseudomonas]|uniref:phosphonate metabolism protein/1,5-bisphosphokinase (PRPP-forming) PhnN n=1 Tax=unclassified Pseudomonas TaxID=196821 RepID=UPI000BD30D4A|nr:MULTISPECIES: phosphonate metabolism protein/1,5-bisphosphokinase (PRPP-forming) PhnN [unclassified Pseudomonas]PVZ13761.1 ribose 1,5-bisphosphokinase [Pseudomonas sp. URIL14HWK12:I12]PVZ24067.1 ribose 1,5-bisphosphokinase [Pseudomonas sp. URIL14HWK12:I10]PVZ33294.1 ribose 1,5-bisphosphokinase [Pseudomonas sp. URIL14HWK12:I11]SNZ11042.1 ribose 1,5-bisphosphokinase [Pseudomonas sp. URIL14HWK12:I9]